MSAIVSSIDSVFNRNFGTNGHAQHEWSKNIEEKILQMYFQLVRNTDVSNAEQKTKYNKILSKLFSKKSKFSQTDRIQYASLTFKMIAQTRDVIAGKGEYSLTHMMISCWANAHKLPNFDIKYDELCLNCAKHALKSIVLSENTEHPLGSWKDIKYFLNYLSNKGQDISNPIFEYAICLLNDQIKIDYYNYNTNCSGKISLAAKWVPRESSNKFGWLNYHLAKDFYQNYGWDFTAETPEQKKRLKIKMLTQYRKMISCLNRTIDTTQIKQCDKRWSEINFDKNVTSITMSKQKNAFLNTSRKSSKNQNQNQHQNQDRIECAEHFKEYLERCASGKCEMKGKRVSIYDFVKDGLKTSNSEEIEKTINLQWTDNSRQNTALENMIAMVDVSGSMSCDNNTPLYNAIGLGLRIAEKSIIGKRILTFSSTPDWVDFDDCNNFCEMVKKIGKANWGMNTNFYAAFEKIRQAYIQLKVDPDLMENMCLVILSDMQIDEASENKMNTMFEAMEAKFADTGNMSEFKKPYKLPTIVFWNLRLTKGFPNTAYTKNTVMISGFSPIVLNLLVDKGIEGLKEFTPWTMFLKVMNHERYASFDGIIVDLFSSV